jgi:hypothetical protein
MRRYRPRSDYTHALNQARKARRRGDVASAERWLKHADRYVLLDEHLEASLHRTNLREAEMAFLRSADAKPSKDSETLHCANHWYELQNELERVNQYWGQTKDAKEG